MDWIDINPEVLEAGETECIVSLLPNTGREDRNAILVFSSAGVVEQRRIIQKGRPAFLEKISSSGVIQAAGGTFILVAKSNYDQFGIAVTAGQYIGEITMMITSPETQSISVEPNAIVHIPGDPGSEQEYMFRLMIPITETTGYADRDISIMVGHATGSLVEDIIQKGASFSITKSGLSPGRITVPASGVANVSMRGKANLPELAIYDDSGLNLDNDGIEAIITIPVSSGVSLSETVTRPGQTVTPVENMGKESEYDYTINLSKISENTGRIPRELWYKFGNVNHKIAFPVLEQQARVEFFAMHSPQFVLTAYSYSRSSVTNLSFSGKGNAGGIFVVNKSGIPSRIGVTPILLINSQQVDNWEMLINNPTDSNLTDEGKYEEYTWEVRFSIQRTTYTGDAVFSLGWWKQDVGFTEIAGFTIERT